MKKLDLSYAVEEVLPTVRTQWNTANELYKKSGVKIHYMTFSRLLKELHKEDFIDFIQTESGLTLFKVKE